MKNVIIGTAGHIDHGKTTLIKALTGRNTDRWEEEQRRGITIDLGFTYFDLPGGDRAGIIDVPGHEKFINNMVAGVVGMDLVLLVVAADEGIMPQTREHVDILSLLGLEKSIIVLNKCDLVDEEWMELVEEEVKEELEGTFLEKAPVVKVSAATGEGLSALVELIGHMTSDELVQKDIHTKASHRPGLFTVRLWDGDHRNPCLRHDPQRGYAGDLPAGEGEQDTQHTGAWRGQVRVLCRAACGDQPVEHKEKRDTPGVRPCFAWEHEDGGPFGCAPECAGQLYACADEPHKAAFFYRDK